jgi:hypothetical protein
MALHQRTSKIEIVTGEIKFSVLYQHKKNDHCTESVVYIYYFCRDDLNIFSLRSHSESPEGDMGEFKNLETNVTTTNNKNCS